MKRQLAAGLAILAVVGGVGWKLASHPETSAKLQDINLVPDSEHSFQGPTGALAGIRIRLSPSNFDGHVVTTAHAVPRIPLAAR